MLLLVGVAGAWNEPDSVPAAFFACLLPACTCMRMHLRLRLQERWSLCLRVRTNSMGERTLQ